MVRSWLWILLLLLPLTAIAQDGWELKRSKDGIQMYTRSVEGSRYKEFLGVTTIPASLSSFAAVYQDIDTYADWMPNVSRAELLRAEGDTVQILQVTNPAPWPVADRDAIWHYAYRQEPTSGVLTIRMEGIPDFAPEQPGTVRIPSARGGYRFMPMEDGRVRVRFQMHVEAGGRLSPALVNWKIVDGPFKTLQRLRDRVRMEPYANTSLSFIKSN